MKRIAIIGAGQLGSRHLQGLAKSNVEINIEVAEPFESSRQMAESRFEEIPHNINVKQIDFFESIQNLSSELDLAIVATNADVRYEVVKELLETKNVKYLVLEKVLFQKVDEYYEVEKLLKKTKTKCWVNHARRMYPFYKNLKEKLSNSKQISFSVSGGAWGLGCNGLHFLDCMQYLTDSEEAVIDTKYLQKKLFETKRAGFKELNGLMVGSIKNSTFAINCFEEETSPVQFNITSNNLNIVIDESNGWYKISEKINDWQHEIKEEKIVYFQSELTNILVEDIFNGKCNLPTYQEAMTLHIKYLNALNEHINNFSEIKYDFCPIT